MKSPLLFSGLSEADVRDLLAAGQARLLKRHEMLGHQGHPADAFAMVQIGHLKLVQLSAGGSENLVRFIGPGDCYGAVALVSGARYPLSAIAVEPSQVLTWTREAIGGLTERLPQLKSNILEEVMRRMSGVLFTAQDLATTRVPQRVAHALLRLAESGGCRTPAGVQIVHPVTRQDLAELTGTSLFTVSRLMSHWEAEGLLLTRRGALTLLDPDALERAGAAAGE